MDSTTQGTETAAAAAAAASLVALLQELGGGAGAGARGGGTRVGEGGARLPFVPEFSQALLKKHGLHEVYDAMRMHLPAEERAILLPSDSGGGRGKAGKGGGGVRAAVARLRPGDRAIRGQLEGIVRIKREVDSQAAQQEREGERKQREAREEQNAFAPLRPERVIEAFRFSMPQDIPQSQAGVRLTQAQSEQVARTGKAYPAETMNRNAQRSALAATRAALAEAERVEASKMRVRAKTFGAGAIGGRGAPALSGQTDHGRRAGTKAGRGAGQSGTGATTVVTATSAAAAAKMTPNDRAAAAAAAQAALERERRIAEQERRVLEQAERLRRQHAAAKRKEEEEVLAAAAAATVAVEPPRKKGRIGTAAVARTPVAASTSAPTAAGAAVPAPAASAAAAPDSAAGADTPAAAPTAAAAAATAKGGSADVPSAPPSLPPAAPPVDPAAIELVGSEPRIFSAELHKALAKVVKKVDDAIFKKTKDSIVKYVTRAPSGASLRFLVPDYDERTGGTDLGEMFMFTIKETVNNSLYLSMRTFEKEMILLMTHTARVARADHDREEGKYMLVFYTAFQRAWRPVRAKYNLSPQHIPATLRRVLESAASKSLEQIDAGIS